MIVARQSTARTVTVGPVLDASGVAVTDCVVGDFKIAKNGGAPAALNASATLTHRHTGIYSLALTASDLDTVGQAEVTIDDTVNACNIKDITVIEEAVYDAMFAASAAGYSTLTQTQVSGGAYALNSASFAFASAMDFTTTQKAATLARVTLVDTLTTYTGNTPQTGDSYAIVNSGTHGNAAIKGYVDDIGVAGAGLTALGDTRLANLDAAMTSRMASYTQPTGFLAATFPTTVASTTNITAGTITTVTNLTNLPAITANWLTAAGTAADFGAEIADAVWDEATSGHTTAGTTGKALTDAGAGGTPPTVIEIADEVQTRTIAAVTTVSTTTNLTNLPAIPTDWITADGLAADAGSEIATAVRSELTTELGRIDVASSTLATASALATTDGKVDAIKAKTDQFVFTVANQVDANALTGGGGLDAAGVRAAVGLASANLDTQLDALPTLAEILAGEGDTGVSLAKALEMLAAFIAGKVSVSSGGGISTYTYKKRDGSTTSFTSLCSETGGTRATTGSLS